jgi:uncharacterized protein Yka (UPF0111/DUF47 family)
MSLVFRDDEKNTTTVSDGYSGGLSKAKKASEGKNSADWYKLNEEAVTAAMIGSIDSINTQIDKHKKKLESLKSKLTSLKSTLGSSSASCSGEVSCNVPGVISSITSSHASEIAAHIEVIESEIDMLESIKAFLCFIKPNNMYFKEKKG